MKKSIWFLYVLECNNNKIYVGITYGIKKRILQHLEGRGATFTKKNPPLQCIELFELDDISRDEAELYETYKTIEWATKIGGENVAGGVFCVTDDGSRKRAIDNAIKKNEINICGKQYKLNDETLISKLKECSISEISDYVTNVTKTEIQKAIEEKTPITIEGSYLFSNKPTTILSFCKENTQYINIDGSNDGYEFWRVVFNPKKIKIGQITKKIEQNKETKEETNRGYSFDEVNLMVRHIECLKHKTLVAMCLLYKNKPGRMVRIKLEDINRREMTINIPRKIGNPSSTLPMEQGLLDLIEIYYKNEKIKPTYFLFMGNNIGHYWGGGNVSKLLLEIKKTPNI